MAAGAAAAAVAAVMAAARAIARRGEGSVESIRDRGVMRQGNVARVGPGASDAMKKVNTVRAPELSEEAIAEARRRRARDLQTEEGGVAGMDIPDNHPWAEKKDVSQDELEEIKQRLAPTERERRRGLL